MASLAQIEVDDVRFGVAPHDEADLHFSRMCQRQQPRIKPLVDIRQGCLVLEGRVAVRIDPYVVRRLILDHGEAVNDVGAGRYVESTKAIASRVRQHVGAAADARPGLAGLYDRVQVYAAAVWNGRIQDVQDARDLRD